MLNQRISIYSTPSFNAEGREVFTGSVVVKCRFQQMNKRKLLPNGDIIMIDGKVFVPGNTDVETNNKVVFDSVDYKVLSKYVAVDGQGNTHHIELELIKWQST